MLHPISPITVHFCARRKLHSSDSFCKTEVTECLHFPANIRVSTEQTKVSSRIRVWTHGENDIWWEKKAWSRSDRGQLTHEQEKCCERHWIPSVCAPSLKCSFAFDTFQFLKHFNLQLEKSIIPVGLKSDISHCFISTITHYWDQNLSLIIMKEILVSKFSTTFFEIHTDE